MAKVNLFELAILEFRSGQFVEEDTSGEWAGGDLSDFVEQQAVRIKSADPDGPPVLVYRSGMWAGSMFVRQWDAFQNQGLSLTDDRLCDGFISYPKDVDESGFDTDLQYGRWDFTNPETQEVFDDLRSDAFLPTWSPTTNIPSSRQLTVSRTSIRWFPDDGGCADGCITADVGDGTHSIELANG